MNTRYFKSVAPIALVVILFSVFPAIASQNKPVSSHEVLASKLDIASDSQSMEKDGQTIPKNRLLLTKAERQWLKTHPVITLGCGLRPPSVFIDDDGNKVGISIDYINLLGTMLGVEFRIAPGTWGSSLSKVRKKEIDGILGIVRSPERETYLNFSEPYVSSYIAIVMRNSSPKAASYRELAGKRVAAEKGDYIAGYLAANYPDIKLSSDFPDHQSALNSLVTGDVEAAVGALPVLSWYMDKMLLSDISVTGLPPETHKSVHIGIREDWPEFIGILNKAINAVSDLEFRKITRKYISVDIAPQPQKAALSDEEKAWLKAHPEIVLGTDRTWAPFVVPGTDGTVKGVESNFIKLINQATGANIRLELGQWSEMVEKARTRKIDGLAVGTYHKERSAFLVFSDTAYTIHKSIFTKKRMLPNVGTMSDLKGLKVGYQAGNLFEEKILKRVDGCIPIAAENMSILLDLLDKNQVDAIIGSANHLIYAAERMISDIELAFFIPSGRLDICYSVRSDWPQLQSIINKGLSTIPFSERLEILSKWGIKDSPFFLNEAEKAWIEKHPVIRVSNEMDWPPYDFVRDGKPSGYSVDYVRLIAEKLGIAIEFVNGYSWDELVDLFCSKQIDLLHPADKPKKILNCGFFTDAFIREKLTFLTRKDYRKVDGMEDLTGAVVALQKGWETTEKVMAAYGGKITPFYVNSSVEGAKAVAKGQADAVIDYTSVLEYLQYDLGLTNVKISGLFDYVDYELFIGVRKDLPMLYQLVQKARKQISQKEIQTLQEKWLKQTDEPGAGLQISESELAWLKNHPTIRVGVDPAWGPIEFLDSDGNYKGLSIDYLKKIETQLGIEFKIIRENWQLLIDLAKKQKLDLFTCVASTPQREEYLTFTEPYIQMPAGIFAGDDVAYISDFKQIAEKKISAVEGYAITDYLTANHPDVNLVLVKNPEEGIRKVKKKEAFAYIDNVITTGHILSRKGYLDIKLVGEFPFVYAQRMGIRKDWPQFRDILQKAIYSIPDADRNAIYNKWVPITYEKPADYSLIWKIGAGGLLFICVIFFWNRRLAAEVNRKTNEYRESESKFKALAEFSVDTIMRFDNRHRCLYVNPIVESHVGIKPADFIGKTYGEIGFPDDLVELWGNAISKVFDEGKLHRVEFLLPNGTWLDWLLTPEFSPDGEVRAVITSARDITDLKRAEQVLLEREKELKRLSSAIKQVAEAIVITDAGATIQYVNPAFEKLTGYTSEEALGKNPSILNSGEHDTSFYKDMWNTLLRGETWTGKLINRSKEGALFIEEATISPVRDASGKVTNYVAVKRDITDEIHFEKQMQQIQKMESLGTLAGGIAHDFNNILFPIIGMSQMLVEDLPIDGPEQRYAKEIFKAGQRASDLVRQILAFSRQSEKKIIPMQIQSVLKEVLKLCRSTIPSDIEISQHIQHGCGFVEADPTQIHQIAMNLITNAYHAVEEKSGKIVVTLKELEMGQDDQKDISLKPGRYARLRVSDSGCGIDPGIIDKIFDPYFTTKEQGKGTGLGLATIHGIVMEYQGDITVDTVLGKGTTFNIYLPVIEDINETEIEPKTRKLQTGTEKILLVDDEEPIVELEKIILEKMGYRVTSFTSSLEALKVFQSDPKAYDLIITDMAMPQMTGEVISRELKKIRPDIPIIICTGFSERLDEFINIDGILMKPVTKTELTEKVREILDKKES